MNTTSIPPTPETPKAFDIWVSTVLHGEIAITQFDDEFGYVGFVDDPSVLSPDTCELILNKDEARLLANALMDLADRLEGR